MPETLHEISEKLNRAFTEFKATNDAALKEVKEKGVTSAQLEEKLAKVNADVETKQAAFERKLAELEAKGKQPPAPGPEEKKDSEKVLAFKSWAIKGPEQMEPERKKALIASDDTTGGYLAPPEFVMEIIKTVTEFSPVRALARVRPTTARASRHPKRTGQFAAVWVAEQGTRSETTGLKYGMEEIPNHEFFARVDISQQDLEDSAFNLESELNEEFAEQFAVAEGAAFIKGSGVARPEGILTSSAILSHTATGATNTLAADDIITTVFKLKADYARRASWLMNRAQIAILRKLKDGQNQYLWSPGFSSGLAGAAPPTIYGLPYAEATDLDVQVASTSGKNIALLGDFRKGYVISDRVQISIMRDPYTEAESGNVKFVARKRVGGQVVLGEAICKIVT